MMQVTLSMAYKSSPAGTTHEVVLALRKAQRGAVPGTGSLAEVPGGHCCCPAIMVRPQQEVKLG